MCRLDGMSLSREKKVTFHFSQPFGATWVQLEDYHTESVKREKPTAYDISCVWNLKLIRNEHLQKQRHTETDNRLGVPEGGVGGDWSGLESAEASWHIRGGGETTRPYCTAQGAVFSVLWRTI